MLKFVFQFAGDNLIDWLLVSAVPIGDPAPVPVPVLAEAKGEGDGLTVRVARAAGRKCEVSLGVG